MIKLVVSFLAGVVLAAVAVIYGVSKPGSIKANISLSKADVDIIASQFNPSQNVDVQLSKGTLSLICPGTEPDTCKIQFVSK